MLIFCTYVYASTYSLESFIFFFITESKFCVNAVNRHSFFLMKIVKGIVEFFRHDILYKLKKMK